MGALGRYQLLITMLIFLSKVPAAWHSLSMVILHPHHNFTCKEEDVDPCSPNCTEHIFDSSMSTIIAEWDLTCEKKEFAPIAQSIAMLGVLIGSILCGCLSDKIGRKPVLVAAITIQAVCSTAAAYAQSYEVFVILRFLNTIGVGGAMPTSFVLLLELLGDVIILLCVIIWLVMLIAIRGDISGKEWRTAMGILYQVPFSLGHMSLAAFGYYFPQWRDFQLAISLPVFALITYIFILPESPRWCMAKDKAEKAISILTRGARWSGLPTEPIAGHVNGHIAKKHAIHHGKGNFFDLFRTKHLRLYTICISYNWFVCGMCFYGISEFVGDLGGDLHLNIFFAALLQVPGALLSLPIITHLGRRTGLIIADLLIGGPCLIVGILNVDELAMRIMGFIGMCGSMMCFSIVYVYAGEIFPTVVRNVGVGTASMVCRCGSISAPFIATLEPKWVASTVFGAVALLGSVACIFLPETLHSDLFETIDDVENFRRSH